MPNLAPVVIVSTEHHVGLDFVEDFSAQGSVDHVMVLEPSLVNDQSARFPLLATVCCVEAIEWDVGEEDTRKGGCFC